MGIFFEKPTKGPDVTGGLWPIKDRGKFWNRTGRTVSKGDVLQVAWTPGEASEIATNDANSYIPGASNDTVWNTVIDPISSTTVGSSIQRGGCFVVALDASISDNKVVECAAFGLITEAYVVGTVQPGDPLAVTKTNSFVFPVPTTNSVVATYMGPSTTNAARGLERVLLHQGLFAPHRPPAAIS